MDEVNLKFTVDEVNQLMGFFNQLPYGTVRHVHGLVNSIEGKIRAVVESQNAPKVENPAVTTTVTDYLDPHGADC